MPNSLKDFPVARVSTDFVRPAGRYTYTGPDGYIHAVMDSTAFEFYMEASPDAPPSRIADVLDRLIHPLGFELMPEDECEPETTEDGWTRIYLAPIEPVDDLHDGGPLPASAEPQEDAEELADPEVQLSRFCGIPARLALFSGSALGLALTASKILDLVS